MRLSALALALALLSILAARPAEAQEDVYLIRAANGTAAVERLDGLPPEPARGLLVWSDGGQERWLVLGNGWQAAAAKPVAPPAANAPGGVTWARGRSTGSAGGGSAMSAAVELPPVGGTAVLRGAGFVAPARGTRSLSDRPTFRRLQPAGGAALPAAAVVVTDTASKKEVARVTFAAGQTQAACPVALPPGPYFAAANPLEVVSFTVAPPAERPAVLGRADEFAKLAGARGRAAATLVRVEELLVEWTAGGSGANRVRFPAYLGDALDALDAAPAADSGPGLARRRAELVAQAAGLNGEPVPPVPPAADDAPTGVPAVDAARAALKAGRVREAEAELAKVPPGDPRAAGLAALYRAAAAAEGGPGRADEAAELYDAAAAALTAPADAYRARNNAAAFRFRQAQDRLNERALQSIAGVDRPVTATLRAWAQAWDGYAAALAVATPAERPAVVANQARLTALLADIVRTLDPGRAAADLERAAAAGADALAARAGADPAADDVTRGVAAEARALLALRDGDAAGARALAAAALAPYAQAGFLPGVEAAYRVLGQAALAAKDDSAARANLQAAHLLGDLLRDRLPPDATGTALAGFFARRAFVLDELVELEVRAGDAAAALGYAELAKARALQDVLRARAGGPARPLADALAAWPADVAAVEYFFGRDKGYLFVVSPGGKVKAHPMAADPRLFLADVQRYLRGVEGYAPKMLNRYLGGRGFDNAWQDKLHEFAGVLVPPDVLAELRAAKTVVVVPQHILHYFPFPALVTALDPEPPGTARVARPTFLADEKFTLVNAPSLSAWAALRRRSPAGPVLTEANAIGLVQAPGEQPLPGVESDLANLKSAFGPRLRTVLTGDQATARKARGLLSRPGLLMVATHGFNEADRPLESFLVLLPDAADAAGADGKLRARDVFGTAVAADVVVMSACYTGLGDRSPQPGDDLFGLQRAFLQGGARTVLAGLWDVYDGTAPELMGGCLDRLAAGEPIGAAVAGSRRAFLAKYRASTKPEPYLHPYFWAVYGLLGDERPRFAPAK